MPEKSDSDGVIDDKYVYVPDFSFQPEHCRVHPRAPYKTAPPNSWLWSVSDLRCEVDKRVFVPWVQWMSSSSSKTAAAGSCDHCTSSYHAKINYSVLTQINTQILSVSLWHARCLDSHEVRSWHTSPWKNVPGAVASHHPLPKVLIFILDYWQVIFNVFNFWQPCKSYEMGILD